MNNTKQYIETSNGDITDRLLYPYYAKLAAFIPSWLHPNYLTAGGILAAAIAAAFLIFMPTSGAYLFSAFFIWLWCFLDACDGIHARTTNQCSDLGGFLDHAGDTLGLLLIQIALVTRLEIHEPWIFAVLLLRQALFAWLFLIKSYTGALPIPTVGFSSELYIYTALLAAKYFLLDNLIQIGPLPPLEIIRLALLAYYLAIPLGLLELALPFSKGNK